MERNARIAALTYGVVCYAALLRDLPVPDRLRRPTSASRRRSTPAPRPTSAARSSSTRSCSPSSALQHSVMARPRFKAWWTRFVPRADRAQHLRAREQRRADRALRGSGSRSTATVWHVESPLARGALRRPVLRWASGGALLDLPDRPLRPLRPAPGGALLPQARVHREALHDAEPLPLRAPPALRRLDHDVLGGAHDERRTPPVRARHDGVHPGRDPAGGARSRRRRWASRTAPGASARRPSCRASGASERVPPRAATTR